LQELKTKGKNNIDEIECQESYRMIWGWGPWKSEKIVGKNKYFTI